MLAWLQVLVVAFTIVAAVASLLSTSRHPTPRLERPTATRVVRALNRGTLPRDEPDRSVAVQMAQARAATHWTVAMLLGLAGIQVLLARSRVGIDDRVFYGVATFITVVAFLTLYLLVTGRMALRRAAADAGSSD